MRISTLGRHFRESFKNIARNGWMTFASISAVTVTLLLVGVFLVIMMNLNHIADNVQNDVEIKAFLDNAADDADRVSIEKDLKKISGVDTVVFSPRDKELDNLIDDLGENGDVFKPFEQDNPLRDAYIIKTKTPEDVVKVAKKIEKIELVQSVNYGQGFVENLFSFVDIARNIGIVLIAGLLFTAMFLISNTIKITIVARSKEIEIMRLVGATNSFIRWPFFLEGLWLGVFGSIVPIALISIFYSQLYTWAMPQFTIKYLEMLPTGTFILQVSTVLLLLGAIIGMWGSLMSVRKFLKV
ncbi:permease-like cell division protein FtsX [Peribacillus asahii]|uniref:Cell division protein FtsX n=1 Tax=Peribacillus asahii TaxID=228899 RepID=A0A3Q9RRQ7_9BACI|nr:permease-like cell division protein FtsX [Peribacillus asahii]AZV45244.1 cell division protein FtsX [Peribacillus asahii]USK84845.1 permease-like cell division protein FtsX [Peribacillus asahii]